MQFKFVLKAKKCELAIGTKENVIGGDNHNGLSNLLVVVDVPYKSNAPLSILIHDQVATVGAVVGYQV